ncbi:hypothetical protein [Salinimonas sediminis]|uniref:Uncharacterized protein n=1 Tax=Salinimonas sediminis TaxID=2303538 RepID=A0A346NI35_9ALTE|nr:hypothetical protein [Salinimonas sediminis]AXR05192.1 hypothetical protein D0Y50_01675 [Salinimonas sediminis]
MYDNVRLMVTKARTKSIMAVAATTGAVWMFSAFMLPANNHACLENMHLELPAAKVAEASPDCLDTPSISWQQWVQGQSRSYQFHFLDLLELLDGGHSDNRFSSGPSR